MDLALPEMQRPFGRDTLPQLKQLRGKHEVIIQMFVLGMTLGDIADELECSREMVDYTVNGDLGQARVQELRETAGIETAEIARHIHEGARAGALFLKDYVSNPNTPGKEKMKASLELLKMDGHGPITRISGKIDHGFMGERGQNEILTRAKELKIIDTTYTPVEHTSCEDADDVRSESPDAVTLPEGEEATAHPSSPLPLLPLTDNGT